MVRFIKRFLILISTSALIGGCAGNKPIRLAVEQPKAPELTALFWTLTSYDEILLYPINRLTVKRIDGFSISTSGNAVELPPGQHVADLLHEKHVACIWVWFGMFWRCYQSQGLTSLAWTVEPNHSYMPFAHYKCGKNWVWIEDTGQPAAYDFEKYRSYISAAPWVNLASEVRSRDKDKKKVVAGESPPTQCEAKER